LAAAGVLDTAVADELIAAMHLWRKVQGVLRLRFGTAFDEASAPAGARAVLARATGAEDFETLKAEIVATAGGVRRHFDELIHIPGTAAKEP
jgi:glutamate-ammonia-ligase adenylyltransferase